jgi:hypothetical protein
MGMGTKMAVRLASKAISRGPLKRFVSTNVLLQKQKLPNEPISRIGSCPPHQRLTHHFQRSRLKKRTHFYDALPHSSFVIRSSELGIWNFPPPVTQLSQPANCRNEILPVSVQSRIGTEFNEQIFCQLMPCRQEI